MTRSVPQSTNHVLMIEPASFYANPETMETNAYQVDSMEDKEEITRRAVQEFRGLRDLLVENGVNVTSAKGLATSPDMVFPNWFFSLPDRRLMLCPMLNQNRRDEREPALVKLLGKMHKELIDWTKYEDFDLSLESTASIVSDRVNDKCFAALSARTDESLARKWAEYMGYDLHLFKTKSHKGIPVYHTDCVMWIGTTVAGLCTECIAEDDRQRVLSALRKDHEVIEFNNEQLRNFCGNALEVRGPQNEKMLVLSKKALGAMDERQIEMCHEHFEKLLFAPLDTLEQYGGGSARCMLAELF